MLEGGLGEPHIPSSLGKVKDENVINLPLLLLALTILGYPSTATWFVRVEFQRWKFWYGKSSDLNSWVGNSVFLGDGVLCLTGEWNWIFGETASPVLCPSYPVYIPRWHRRDQIRSARADQCQGSWVARGGQGWSDPRGEFCIMLSVPPFFSYAAFVWRVEEV